MAITRAPTTTQVSRLWFNAARCGGVALMVVLWGLVAYLVRSIFWDGGRPFLALGLLCVGAFVINLILAKVVLPSLKRFGPEALGAAGYRAFLASMPGIEKKIASEEAKKSRGAACENEHCEGCDSAERGGLLQGDEATGTGRFHIPPLDRVDLDAVSTRVPVAGDELR